jgi:hypothetical protein
VGRESAGRPKVLYTSILGREPKLIKGAELRVIESLGGHFGLFRFEPS